MKKRIGIGILAGFVACAAMMPVQPAQADQADEVTQGELALLLVNMLGLYRFLPAAPSEQEAIAVLLANCISPEDGWRPAQPVLLADLARLIVQSLDRSHEVAEPDNPQSWIDFLVSIDVPIDTIGLAVSQLEPIPEPVGGGHVFAAAVSADPIVRREVIGLPDEVERGADVAPPQSLQRPVTLPEIVDVIEAVPDVPPRPPVPTPI